LIRIRRWIVFVQQPDPPAPTLQQVARSNILFGVLVGIAATVDFLPAEWKKYFAPLFYPRKKVYMLTSLNDSSKVGSGRLKNLFRKQVDRMTLLNPG
jgi:hypothetical protein